MTQPTWSYEYLPYTAQDGHEIPCFRIYPEDDPEGYVAETNEHLPHDVQEANARLLVAAPKMLGALAIAEQQLSEYCLGDDGRDKSAQVALRTIRAAIASATGRAT